MSIENNKKTDLEVIKETIELVKRNKGKKYKLDEYPVFFADSVAEGIDNDYKKEFASSLVNYLKSLNIPELEKEDYRVLSPEALKRVGEILSGLGIVEYDSYFETAFKTLGEKEAGPCLKEIISYLGSLRDKELSEIREKSNYSENLSDEEKKAIIDELFKSVPDETAIRRALFPNSYVASYEIDVACDPTRIEDKKRYRWNTEFTAGYIIRLLYNLPESERKAYLYTLMCEGLNGFDEIERRIEKGKVDLISQARTELYKACLARRGLEILGAHECMLSLGFSEFSDEYQYYYQENIIKGSKDDIEEYNLLKMFSWYLKGIDNIFITKPIRIEKIATTFAHGDRDVTITGRDVLMIVGWENPSSRMINVDKILKEQEERERQKEEMPNPETPNKPANHLLSKIFKGTKRKEEKEED